MRDSPAPCLMKTLGDVLSTEAEAKSFFPLFFCAWKTGVLPLEPFCSAYFGDGVLRTICLGWPQISILLISASQVARITDVSHWC
jgi:hypothetical protein